MSQGIIPDENHFIQFQDSRVAQLTVDLLSSPYELSENWERKKIHVKTEQENLKTLVASSVLSFKSKKIDQMILVNQKELKETEDVEDYLILVQTHMNLKQVSREINKQLSRIITK